MFSKLKFIIFLSIFLILFSISCTINDSELQIVAFPNPFNPDTSNLKVVPCNIDELSSDNTQCADNIFFANSSISFFVYNIKTEVVYEKSYDSNDFEEQKQDKQIIWNGYTASGNRITAGNYFITVIEETTNETKRGTVKISIQ